MKRLGRSMLRALALHPHRCASGRLRALRGASLKLDFRTPEECELLFFGLTETLVGKGVGRWAMNRAIEFAWSRPIRRFWVHTCSLDHPEAVAFYIRSGFTPYKRQIEVADDPRLTGVLSPTAAPHVPML
jgi:GNAT superfamily N-acetyltransferase